MEKILKKSKSNLRNKIRISKNSTLLVRSIADVQKNTDLLVKETIYGRGVSFDCKKGCDTCCSLRVEVLPPEAFYIANYINTLPADSKNKKIKKLRKHVEYSKGKKLSEYNKPCPFLNNTGACGIYEVRPHKCRAYLSKDVEKCNSTREADEDPTLSDATTQLVNDSVALYKKRKCVMHPTELSQSVLAALDDATLEDRWAKGEQVFELLPEKFRF